MTNSPFWRHDSRSCKIGGNPNRGLGRRDNRRAHESVVNQREPPHWDLGLNLAIPAGRALSASFLEDVAAIGAALGALRRETSKAFVIGVHDAGSDETKDLFTVGSAAPDLEALRSAVGKALALT